MAFQDEVEAYQSLITTTLPASSATLEQYRDAQSKDPVCTTVAEYCRRGWPNKSSISPTFKPYWEVRGELIISNHLLLRGKRIVIPEPLQHDVLTKIHQGHQGIQRCRLRASTSVWWPGISRQIQETVQKCPECVKFSQPHKEPLIASSLPDYPWQRLGSDLFHLNGETYLLVVDYYSRFPEIAQLSSTTSSDVIAALQSIFARHGIPEELRSDNGPQYDSLEMGEFVSSHNFKHITSSPHYPQSSGLAERTVKTVKELLKKSEDPFTALLTYRATPFPWCGLSPAELLMGRRIRSGLPQLTECYLPSWPYLRRFRALNQKFKKQQEHYYNQRHRTRPLPPIPDDTPVWIRTGSRQTLGDTLSRAETPRSYITTTPTGEVRRNRQHLVPVENGPTTHVKQSCNFLHVSWSPILQAFLQYVQESCTNYKICSLPGHFLAKCASRCSSSCKTTLQDLLQGLACQSFICKINLQV